MEFQALIGILRTLTGEATIIDKRWFQALIGILRTCGGRRV